jgi:hypothetical protein
MFSGYQKTVLMSLANIALLFAVIALFAPSGNIYMNYLQNLLK